MLAAVAVPQTLDSRPAEAERQSYNIAFDALGLAWHWDTATFARLPSDAGRVQAYVERHQPHLLQAYDADFLANAVESARQRLADVRA
ncbi:hypothetical protein [Ramlibacter sp.]|uniref:hypothetical protein n=1 Tax=Ramlibacter sp. TaxID=1917967 RepID=UPI003D0A7881